MPEHQDSLNEEILANLYHAQMPSVTPQQVQAANQYFDAMDSMDVINDPPQKDMSKLVRYSTQEEVGTLRSLLACF